MSHARHDFGVHCGEASVVQLAPDCAKCCGLCCVGPSFDADQGFGYSKPAHTPCQYLAPDFRCRVHHKLRQTGFPSCAQFSCYGAGQRVTQRLFFRLSWQSSPEVTSRMFGAYFRVRILHESLVLLERASSRVSPAVVGTLSERLRWLDQLCESVETLPSSADVARIRSDALDLVRLAMTEQRL